MSIPTDCEQFPDDYPPRIRELIDGGSSLDDPARLDIRDRRMRFLEGRPAGPLEFLETQNRRYVALNATLKALGESGRRSGSRRQRSARPPIRRQPAIRRSTRPGAYTGLPTVSFPIGLSPDGMPVAIQLVGYVLDDFELLRDAQWCEQAIRTCAAMKGSSHGR